ncbi:NfeD family protein [Amphibacillus sp. Q70]|uniref:NfeD family protein n=1 Tax=Amphibacillus sp. Q70 TaxID=3453416 RepID=UPI003F86BE53
MDIFTMDWLSFFIVGIGTMLLVGELLVKAKGIFAFLGVSLITLYFYAYLDPSMFFIMAIIYFLGIILIFIDGELINDGTLAGIGAILMIVSVGLSSPNWIVGLYAIIGVVIGAACSFLWLKMLPRRNMWTKIPLIDRLTDDQGYSSINTDYHQLVGQKGIALTNLRPVGTIKINQNEYSAISNGYWIQQNAEIIVKQVDGTRILVDALDKYKE